jgi:hypothetical protein
MGRARSYQIIDQGRIIIQVHDVISKTLGQSTDVGTLTGLLPEARTRALKANISEALAYLQGLLLKHVEPTAAVEGMVSKFSKPRPTAKASGGKIEIPLSPPPHPQEVAEKMMLSFSTEYIVNLIAFLSPSTVVDTTPPESTVVDSLPVLPTVVDVQDTQPGPSTVVDQPRATAKPHRTRTPKPSTPVDTGDSVPSTPVDTGDSVPSTPVDNSPKARKGRNGTWICKFCRQDRMKANLYAREGTKASLKTKPMLSARDLNQHQVSEHNAEYSAEYTAKHTA